MLYDYLGVNSNDHMTISGIDAESLLDEYGSPLYVLDENRIRYNCRQYTEAIAKYLPAGSRPLFASKALCLKGIYPVIQGEGLGADVVSIGEMFTALSADFPASLLYFHGTNKTNEDIAFALDNGLGTFVVDNLNELQELNRQAGERNMVQDVLLRVTVGLDPHTLEAINTGRVDSQFGVPIETGQAAEFVAKALECENINLLGFHSHIGSQIFESDPFIDQIDILIKFSSEIKAQFGYEPAIFNLGGGFGVRYLSSDPTVDIDQNIKEIGEHLSQGCAEFGLATPIILMEPGRSIVADAGVTLYRAGGIKTVNGYRNYVTVDGGMTDNPRYALYKSDYTVLNASRASEDADFLCTIAGHCCESGDRIAENIYIAKPTRNDIIAVLTTGAYNYSMASNYNRSLRPAMAMVNNGDSRLIVRRETFEDLINCEL